MYNVDRSASGRIRRLKARTLATYKSLNPTSDDFGGKAQSAETKLLEKVGAIINCTECSVQAPESSLCSPTILNTIATYLRNYMSEFRNSNFWAYQCDGDGYYVNDGGDDMYDGSNFTTPWLLSGETFVTDADEEVPDAYPYAISYETVTQTVVDTDFNYVSLGYVQGANLDEPQTDTSRHPLTVMGFRCSGPVGWQIGGDIGADNSGELLSAELYNGQTINGFTVYAGYRQMYNAIIPDGEPETDNDPTICNLIILLGHPSWSSVFGTTTIYSDNNTNSNGFYYYAGTGSANILGIHTVLSKPRGDNETPIPDSELQTVVANLTQRIAESLGL